MWVYVWKDLLDGNTFTQATPVRPLLIPGITECYELG
jgi:hypothetical protein